MAPKETGSLVLSENWGNQWALSIENGEECETGETAQGLADLSFFFFFFSKSLEAIEGFEAEADVCVCFTHGEQYEQLEFIRDILAVVLRMGGRLQECLWGNQDALH